MKQIKKYEKTETVLEYLRNLRRACEKDLSAASNLKLKRSRLIKLIDELTSLINELYNYHQTRIDDDIAKRVKKVVNKAYLESKFSR